MTNKKLMTTLAVSTLAMAQAGLVSADELTPTDPSQPVTEVVTPTVPVTPVETPDEQPSQPTQSKEPSQPVAPTQPSTGDEVTPTEPSQPVLDPSQPVTDSSKPSNDPTPSESEIKPEVSDKAKTPDAETPQKEDKAPVVPKDEPKTTAEANAQGKSQEGTISNSTGQVVSTVSPQAPIETNTGVSIVSTKEGKLILSDGSKVAPETVGAKTNDDKTITVTKADGTKATLPHTGDAQTLGLSLLGLVMAVLGFVGWKKQKR